MLPTRLHPGLRTHPALRDSPRTVELPPGSLDVVVVLPLVLQPVLPTVVDVASLERVLAFLTDG